MTDLLEGRVAVVTGGSSGNGRAICRRFAEFGADVVVADVREKPRDGGTPTHELVAEETDGAARFVSCDVTDRTDLEAAADAAADLGGLDLWVNNAGVFRAEEFLDVDREDLQRFLDVNVAGPFFGAQVAARRMLDADREGCVVNVASIGAIRALGNYTSYDLTKGAVLSMTYSLADRLGDEGIRVNAVVPGIVETAMTTEDVPIVGTDAGERYAASSIPMERFGTPDEVAKAVVFLASDLASYVNGEALVVDGGVTHTG